MPFQLSPGVNVTEIDLTTVIPQVATTEAAIGGMFRWGPVEDYLLIQNEDQLVDRYGKPNNDNFETWFTAANYLAYSDALYVSRAWSTTSYNAIANTGEANVALQVTKNEQHYNATKDGTYDADIQWVAKYPGALGNSLQISVCDSANAYQSNVALEEVDAANTGTANIVFTVGSNTATISVSNSASGDANSSAAVLTSVLADIAITDQVLAGNSTISTQYLQVTAKGTVTKTEESGSETGEATVTISFSDRYRLSENFSSDTVQRFWAGQGITEEAPGQSNWQLAQGNTSAQDEMHIVVYDEDGKITGTPGTPLEVWQRLSRATDAKNDDGAANYYKEVINQGSRWIWFANDRANAVSNTAENLASSTNDAPYVQSFVGGTDSVAESSADALAPVIRAFDLFKSAEDVDVSLILTGKSIGGSTTFQGRTVIGTQLPNYLIDNIAETRKDCVVYLSPERGDVVNNAAGDIERDVTDFRNICRSTSYAVMDSGYKYQYDKYNDVYRYVPLNGDTAGLTAYTADIRDAWWSPAGFNRGNIKNLVRLAWNPKKAERDVLYKSGVNPVVSFPGQGTVLFGDKTLLAKPSAFDRINVRRLFIVLEKAIATSAKFTLFEFNDAFTRASFVNLVTPFLRDVQGRRGITDFVVVCDETNNTGEVIDRNEFIGDIYIKPARSINFIQLNFVAVRTGVEFSEVIGQF